MINRQPLPAFSFCTGTAAMARAGWPRQRPALPPINNGENFFSKRKAPRRAVPCLHAAIHFSCLAHPVLQGRPKSNPQKPPTPNLFSGIGTAVLRASFCKINGQEPGIGPRQGGNGALFWWISSVSTNFSSLFFSFFLWI